MPDEECGPSGARVLAAPTQHSRAGLLICRAYGALGFALLAQTQ